MLVRGPLEGLYCRGWEYANHAPLEVDTRALQVIYAVDEIDSAVYVGQQVDVFIDAGIRTDEVDSIGSRS
jgi:hypothetical protein